MSQGKLRKFFGREAFGGDPSNYHHARPTYPREVWAALRQRLDLTSGATILEIGAGTGLATEPLLAFRPKKLVAVEPDARLAAFLAGRLTSPALHVVVQPFEATEWLDGSFDLAVSATAFHWLEAIPALRKIHKALRPSGLVVLLWLFGPLSTSKKI